MATLLEHADQSRDELTSYLNGQVNPPGTYPDALMSVNTGTRTWQLLARSTNDNCADAASTTPATPRDDLVALTNHPTDYIASQAHETLRQVDALIDGLDQIAGSDIRQAPEALFELVDTVRWERSYLASASIQPALTRALKSLTLDGPDTFLLDSGAYHRDYIQIGRIIAVTGRSTLDAMELTPARTLIIAAVSAAEAATDMHASSRRVAGHYQHLVTRDVIDQVLQSARNSNLTLFRSIETMGMLLNMCALSPNASSEQLPQLHQALARIDIPACHVAAHPNTPQATRERIVDQLADDHPCRWRITGTPADVHQQALDRWRDERGNIDWFAWNGTRLGAATVIELADTRVDWDESSLDWDDASWVSLWVRCATHTLDERHLGQLSLNALAALALNAHDSSIGYYCTEDSLETLAAVEMSRRLDPLLARYPYSIHLLGRITQLPDTVDELDTLLDSIYSSRRRIRTPATPGAAADPPINHIWS